MREAIAAGPVRIACLGDSITEGAQVDARLESYPARLQEMLGDKFLVRNFGAGGATLWHGGKPNAFQQLPAARTFAPHIAVLAFGNNDTRNRDVDYWDHFPEFPADAAKRLTEILAMPGSPGILLCLAIANFADLPGMPAERRENVAERLPRLVEVRQQLRKTAAEFESRGVTLCDLHAVTEHRPDVFAVDGVHLKADGYLLLAETIRKRIPRALRKFSTAVRGNEY